MFKDLNEFIAALDKERELARITDPVSPDLEICAVTDRVSKSPGGGPALLFERPAGFDIPVVIVQHRISDPETFFAAAQAGTANLPGNLRLHHVFPEPGGSRAVCLWEAESVDAVRDFVEPAVGNVSQNDYFEVDSGSALGLPQP